MKIELIEINSFRRELSVIVPWADLEGDYKQEFEHWLSNDTPKGGRKGKHNPQQRKIFKNKHQATIELSFREKAMNKFYQQALEQQKLQPINKAEITKIHLEEGSDLEFIAIFEVIPAFKLPNYSKKSNALLSLSFACSILSPASIHGLKNVCPPKGSPPGQLKVCQ